VRSGQRIKTRKETTVSNNVIPNQDADLLVWLNQHAGAWQASFAQIGLTQNEANAFTAASEDAQRLYNA
jgi:hypothetical protein